MATKRTSPEPGKLSYSEPRYVTIKAATAIVSETRAITIHPNALTWLNTFLDELLFLTLSAVSAHSDATSVPSTPSGGEGSLLQLPLTTERYKSNGVLRVLPNQLGKNAVLEAELAVRELARNGQREWRQDPALRPAALVALASSPTPESKTVKTVFEDLRLQVEQLCTLGTKQRPVPGQALALYCSTILAFIAEYALRGLARIVERDPVRSEGRTAELFAAMGEDEALWSCFEGMRTRSYIERDLAVSRKASTTSRRAVSGTRSGSSHESRLEPALPATAPSTADSDRGSKMQRTRSRSNSIKRTAKSSDSKREGALSPTKFLDMARPTATRAERSSSEDAEEDEAEFESLIRSSETMKVSLTPNRLKTMEAHERNKSARSKVSPVVTPGEQAFSRPKGASTPPALADFALKPFAVKPASTPRLQARAATKYAVEEDDDTSSDGFAANGGKKESLADFFNSVPPWEKDEGAIVPSTEDRNEVDAKIAANRARRLAKQKAEAAAALSVSAAAPVTPMDPDVMPAPSMSRARSQPNLLGANTPARRKLQAKDERETRPSARDMIDFLSAGPAPVARPITRARSESVSATSQTTSTSSRRGNRLKTFMGKFGNSHADAEDEVSPPASPAGTLPRKLHSKRGGSVSSNTTISSLSPVFHPPTTAIQPARFVYQAPEARPSTGMESLGITTTMSRSSSQDVYRTPSSSMPPSRSTHGMLTPDSSMEDVARRSYITKPPESDLPTPPLSVHQSPTRVKRISVPSHVPSEAAEMLAELAKDKTDEEASRRLSAVSAATVAASIQAKAQAKHDIGVQTAVTTPTPLEPVSVLVEALLALRERMAAAPAEQHLAILDETIASLPPADDDAASRAAYMVEMEARVVELFLSGGADLSSSATTILTPDTPGLTDQSDDEAEGETLRTPVVPLSTLAPPEVDEDEETGVLGKMDRIQLRKQQEHQRRAVHSLLEA